MKLMSLTFAAMASLCFVSGLFIISSEGDNTHASTRNTSGLI